MNMFTTCKLCGELVALAEPVRCSKCGAVPGENPNWYIPTTTTPSPIWGIDRDTNPFWSVSRKRVIAASKKLETIITELQTLYEQFHTSNLNAETLAIKRELQHTEEKLESINGLFYSSLEQKFRGE